MDARSVRVRKTDERSFRRACSARCCSARAACACSSSRRLRSASARRCRSNNASCFCPSLLRAANAAFSCSNAARRGSCGAGCSGVARSDPSPPRPGETRDPAPGGPRARAAVRTPGARPRRGLRSRRFGRPRTLARALGMRNRGRGDHDEDHTEKARTTRGERHRRARPQAPTRRRTGRHRT